ncbi:MAG: hypothetical protein ACI4JZ_00645 [Oscillospiraceae bacterium]
MVKKMFVVSGASLVLLFAFWGMFLGTKKPAYFTFGIIAMTICYHFTVRLVIGGMFDFFLKNNVNYRRKWFAERDFEKNLYKKLRVKKWKKILPTADEDLFSLEKKTPEQVIMAGCQAEIVHECCAAAGLLSMFLAFPFGYFWVFFGTSVAAALCDLAFVAIQRFNRPRLLKFIERKTQNV